MTAGFPELTTREPKCKLCQLTDSHRGLLTLVHRLRHEEGYGPDAIRTRIRGAFDRSGLVAPSARSIGRHFEEHVDFSQMPEPDALALPDPVEVTLERIERDTSELRILDPEDMAMGRDNSDYHQLVDLFRRLLRRVTALDEDPTAFRNADGSHAFQKLNAWTSMVDNARKIIEGLNKMRNTDRMTISILEQHTKRFATEFTRPVAGELRAIGALLSTSNDPVARAAGERIAALLNEGVRDIMTGAAVRALQESKQEYKLLN